MTRRSILLLLIAVSLLSCRPAAKPSVSDIGVVTPAPDSVAAAARIDPVVVFVQGSPRVLRSGAEIEAAEGTALREGDRVTTDAVSSLEIAFGSFATVRALPSSDIVIRSVRSRAVAAAGKDAAELAIGAGSLLAKVRKLSGDDEFYIVTPNSAAGVRGTEFLVRYEAAAPASGAARSRAELTRVAVREGRVALLPKRNLMEGLLDGRDANPVAGAVVKTVFTLAPAASAGEELSVGGGVGAAGAAADASAMEAADAAYGAVLRAAEEATAAGFDLEAAADPAAFIAAPGSSSGDLLRKAFGASTPRAAGSDAEILELLDRLRDPGSSESRLPAALPLQGFDRGGEAGAKKPAPPAAPSYPAVAWSIPVSRKAIAEPPTRLGDFVIVTGSDGVVRAFGQDGKTAWSVPSDAVAATALDATLAVVGADSLAIVDGRDGRELGKWAFDGWAGTPRSKAVPVPEGVAVATPRGVAVLRSENAALVREILVEGGLAAPPVLAGRELVAVTGRGTLVVIDLAKNAIAAEIPAGLSGGAFAPRYRDGVVCAEDRSGKIAALDVASRTLRWERSLGVGIAAEAEMDDARVFVWTSARSLVTLAIADGSDAREAVGGVESAPLLSNGRLYWGAAGGKLVVADAATGRILKRIDVGQAQSVRPLMIGNALYAGTANGNVIKIDPDK